MDRSIQQRRLRFQPSPEAVEDRALLSGLGGYAGALGPLGYYRNPKGYEAVRPNTPVLPYAASLATATFIDPYAHVLHGEHVIAGARTYVAPYATLNATTGFIKIGSGSIINDNAAVVSNPLDIKRYPTSVLIGDTVSVGTGARIAGPSVIGGYGARNAAPTGIGANAFIDGATIGPGAVVGELARVGPGLTIFPGYYVLPGSNVTTVAQATRPALGMVELLPAAVLADLRTALTRGPELASGYTNLYQGNSATGVSPGVPSSVTSIFNGDLAAVTGASQEPGPATVTAATGINFEPSRVGPQFPLPVGGLVEPPGDLPFFRARVIGDTRFFARAKVVQSHLGRSNSIRADQGQPIVFANTPTTGQGVTISSPLGGSTTTTTTTITNTSTNPRVVSGPTTTTTAATTSGGIVIGANFTVGAGAVILGGAGTNFFIGDNVSIGQNSVISRSTLGPGVTVGAMSYVSNSLVPPGTVIPDHVVVVNDRVVGTVGW